MQGMYNVLWFDDFSIKDLGKFQKDLIRWANQNGANAMMLFDKTSLGNLLKIETNDSFSVHQIYLSNITIELICISAEICVLRKIVSSKETVYQIPKSCKGTNIWYAFPYKNA